MTQQYLVGELSVRLEQLQVTATRGAARDMTRLRWQVESGSPDGLAVAARRALALADESCWGSLSCGDVPAFATQASAAAELRQFAICARLLPEGC